MVTPRPNLLRTLAILASTIATCCLMTGCGNGPARSSTTETKGAGGLMIGQSRATVESSNDGWTIHATRPDGPCTVVVYRDYHWSLARGFTHSAEYHHVTYTADQTVAAWVSNSNPDSTRE